MSQEFQPYLDQVTRHVERDPGLVFEIQSELRTHLECAADEFEAQGFSHQEAIEESLKAFGDPAQLALEFKSTYGSRPALGQSLRFIAVWLVFPLAFLAVQLAWTGLREAWWHESSGWYGAKSMIRQIKSSYELDPSFLPDNDPEYRRASWRFMRDGGTSQSVLSGAPPDAQYIQTALLKQNLGIYHAFHGALYTPVAPPLVLAPGPAPGFEPWNIANRFSTSYWAQRRRDKSLRLGVAPWAAAPTSAPMAMQRAIYPQEYLAAALDAPTLGDATAAYWHNRLSIGTPTGFNSLVSAYAARFGAQGLCLTIACADQYIALAEEKADTGDISGAAALLDNVDRLVARQMRELPATRAILPLAVYRLVYLPDCREGILGDKAGPGPDPLALAALSHELAPFQSAMYLPGIKPRATPIPPGGWAQASGWVSLVNNLLVISLACLTFCLGCVWLHWAIAVLVVNGQVPAHMAPGLLPKSISRVLLPLSLTVWGALAVLFAGFFAHPAMRFDAVAWTSYPIIILLTVVAYAFICIWICRRHAQTRGCASGISEKHLIQGRRFSIFTFMLTLGIIGALASFANLTSKPWSPWAIPGFILIFGVTARWEFKRMDHVSRVLTFIQIRSFRLSLGIAVALLSLACLTLYAVECVTAWAAWQSNALSQPVSEEFKREILNTLTPVTPSQIRPGPASGSGTGS